MTDSPSSPAYETETDGVTIRVTPKFLDEESEPAAGRYVWQYTVEIENGSEGAWTLTLRHWEIVDSQGRRQTVDGEGVIGQQPRLERGKSFKYTSGAPLASPSGIMGGHYTLTDDSGTEMTAYIPTFSLDSPYEITRPS